MKSSANLDFDWSKPGALGEHYLSRLQMIQRSEPIFWSSYQNAWIVTRHQDIVDGLRDFRLSNIRFHLAIEHHTQLSGKEAGPLLRAVRGWLFNMDGPDHLRLRRLLIKPFGNQVVQKFRQRTEQLLDGIVSSVEQRPSVEFVSEIALPYAASTLAHVIGFDTAISANKMIEWSNTIAAVFATGKVDKALLNAADATIDELTPLVQAEIASRRRHPRDDLLTALIEASDGGDRLSEGDIIGLFHVLLLAAFETTANTLTLFMQVIDRDENISGYIRTHPDRIGEVVEELQRQVAMLNMMHRVCSEDFEWHGIRLKRGDLVYLMLGVGNWDETVYPRPSEVDFERTRHLPLMFAPGLHHCIGHNLAKMELEVSVLYLLRRFDRIRVLNDKPPYALNYINRSLERLDVRFESTS